MQHVQMIRSRDDFSYALEMGKAAKKVDKSDNETLLTMLSAKASCK